MRSPRNHHISRVLHAIAGRLGLEPAGGRVLIAANAGRMNGFDMAGDKKKNEPLKAQTRPSSRSPAPGWQQGLRKLYDSVVDEPLPSSFDDLLKKLDKPDGE